MKKQKALEIIGSNPIKGYRVAFEYAKTGVLESDYFPERDEPETELISSEEEAWDLAAKFAAKTRGECVNIYVVTDSFKPVNGYAKRKIINR